MKGLTLRQIPKGKPGASIKVVRLHYSADPTMLPERVALLKSAYPDITMWDREMEIDSQARGGQKWFPEFDEAIHYIDPPEEDWESDNWTTWLACDPHPRRAHAFVWLMVNKYGDMLVPWSLWPEEQNMARHDQGLSRFHCVDYVKMLQIIERRHLFPISHIDLMDPAGENFDAAEDVNYFQKYREAGIIFRAAKKNRQYAGYDRISEKLRLTEYEGKLKPLLRIVRGAGDNDILVSQIKGLRYKELKGVAVDEKDPPPDPLNKDKHLVDCLSYILLDEPRFVELRRRGANRGELPRTLRVGP